MRQSIRLRLDRALVPSVRQTGGRLELRMIDAQQGDDWIVALAVASALLGDPIARETARRACEPVHTRRPGGDDAWWRATHDGPHDPILAKAAATCFEAAITALGRAGASMEVQDAVVLSAERYTSRGRRPADDAIARHRGLTPA